MAGKMSDERLAQCERMAVEWDERWQRNTIAASVDALAAAGFVHELCVEVRRLRAHVDALQPRCDVCDLPLHGMDSELVVVRKADGSGLEYRLGVCCENKPFHVPRTARPCAKIREHRP